MEMEAPRDALSAVTHPDPYPYYAGLEPLAWNAQLGIWIAAGARAVDAAFACDAARVRPPGEPVPKSLIGSDAGLLFSRWARTNDGACHAESRAFVTQRLGPLDAVTIERHADACVKRLQSASLDGFVERMPIDTFASALGVDFSELDGVFTAACALARSFAPGATAQDAADGSRAARELSARFAAHVSNSTAVANDVGLLFQTLDATRALIGNTLVSLARHPHVLASARRDPNSIASIVDETLRFDSPVQNTRRFFAGDARIDGVTVRRGDAMLLVLAAANRDPAANPEPDRFDPARSARRIYTFGEGSHACPGHHIAVSIATFAVRRLLAAGLDVTARCSTPRYRQSTNVRLPLFQG